MEVKEGPPEHGLIRSVALHLGPGAVMLVFYVAAAPWFVGMGYPPLLAGLVSIPLILVPWMLGYLAWDAKQWLRSSTFAAISSRPWIVTELGPLSSRWRFSRCTISSPPGRARDAFSWYCPWPGWSGASEAFVSEWWSTWP